MTTSAKNNISQCRSRTRLYETLVRECELLNFEYDTGKSFAHNAGRARDRMMFRVAEIINWTEKLEGNL